MTNHRWMHDAWEQKKELHRHVIVANRFDIEDMNRMLDEIAQFSRAREDLADFTPTGREAAQDAYMSFYKGLPTARDISEMTPEGAFNHSVMGALNDLPDFERLRRYTVGDDVQAALAFEQMEPDIETLFDRTEQDRRKAQELQELLDQLAQARQDKHDVDEMVERWKADHPPSADDEAGDGAQGASPGNGEEDAQDGAQDGSGIPEDLEEAQDRNNRTIADLEAQVDKAMQEVQEALDRVASATRQTLRSAVSQAADEAQNLHESAQAWGMDPADLHRLPADERLALAKRLNTPYFRKIADLFGPMKNLMFTEQTRKVEYMTEEIFDVAIGKDLSRLLPSELLNLATNEDEFLRRFAEGSLLQYEMRGEERLARGGIIFCQDGSGSMRGEKEMWAKAVMLCLLHLARQQNRPFHLIHFGSYGMAKLISFENHSDYSLNAILDAAELFYGGGPLRVDQRVVTPNGWKAIGSVEVGDEVFGPDGQPTKVTGVYPQGELMNMYRVRFSDGAEVICDDGHLWTVRRQSWNNFRTVTLREIIADGIKYEHKSGSWFQYEVPIAAPVELPVKELPLHPYLLGFLLGNGGFTHSSPSVTPTPGDENLWMDFLPTGVTAVQTEKREGFAPNYLLTTGRQRGRAVNPLIEALRTLGLWGHAANGKFIPDDYLWASVEQRWMLLAGLLDADGNLPKPGRVEYSTVSEKLALNVQQLAQSLGCLASIHQRAGRPNEQTLHRVTLRIPANAQCPFGLTRYHDKWRERKQLRRSIVSVEPVDPAECVCIKVEREDGLFLTEGHVVTHNTDFTTPMSIALDIVRDQHSRNGAVKSDVVFCTDDECYVPNDFMDEYLKETERLQFTTYGFAITHYTPKPEGALARMSEKKVFHIRDVLSGNEIREVFRSL